MTGVPPPHAVDLLREDAEAIRGQSPDQLLREDWGNIQAERDQQRMMDSARLSAGIARAPLGMIQGFAGSLMSQARGLVGLVTEPPAWMKVRGEDMIHSLSPDDLFGLAGEQSLGVRVESAAQREEVINRWIAGPSLTGQALVAAPKAVGEVAGIVAGPTGKIAGALGAPIHARMARSLGEAGTTLLGSIAAKIPGGAFGFGAASALTAENKDTMSRATLGGRLDAAKHGAMAGAALAVFGELGNRVQSFLQRGPAGRQAAETIEAWLRAPPSLRDRMAAGMGGLVEGIGFTAMDLSRYGDFFSAMYQGDMDAAAAAVVRLASDPIAFGLLRGVNPSRLPALARAQRMGDRALVPARMDELASADPWSKSDEMVVFEPKPMATRDKPGPGVRVGEGEPATKPPREAQEAAPKAEMVRVPEEARAPNEAMVDLVESGWAMARADQPGTVDLRMAGIGRGEIVRYDPGTGTLVADARVLRRFGWEGIEEPVVTFQGEAATTMIRVLAGKTAEMNAVARDLFRGLEQVGEGVYADTAGAYYTFRFGEAWKREPDGTVRRLDPIDVLAERQADPDLQAISSAFGEEAANAVDRLRARAEPGAEPLVDAVRQTLDTAARSIAEGSREDRTDLEVAATLSAPEVLQAVAAAPDVATLAKVAHEVAEVAAGKSTAEDAIAEVMRASTVRAQGAHSVRTQSEGEAVVSAPAAKKPSGDLASRMKEEAPGLAKKVEPFLRDIEKRLGGATPALAMFPLDGSTSSTMLAGAGLVLGAWAARGAYKASPSVRRGVAFLREGALGMAKMIRVAWDTAYHAPLSGFLRTVGSLTKLLDRMVRPGSRASAAAVDKVFGMLGRATRRLASWVGLQAENRDSRLVAATSKGLRLFINQFSSPASAVLKRHREGKAKREGELLTEATGIERDLFKAFGSKGVGATEIPGTALHAFRMAIETGTRPEGDAAVIYDKVVAAFERNLEALKGTELLEEGVAHYFPHIRDPKITPGEVEAILRRALAEKPTEIATAVARETLRVAVTGQNILGTAVATGRSGASSLKHRKVATEDIDPAKYMLDPRVAIPLRLRQQAMLIANRELLDSVARDPLLSARSEEAARDAFGFDNYSFIDPAKYPEQFVGKLAGKYVHPTVMPQVHFVDLIHRDGLQLLGDVASQLLKQALVVRNPGSAWMQDMTQWMLGLSVGSVGTITPAAKKWARGEIASEGPALQKLRELGLVGTELAAVGGHEQGRSARKAAQTEDPTSHATIGRAANMVYDAVANTWIAAPARSVERAFTNSDVMAKLIYFRDLVEGQGLSEAEAARRLRHAYSYADMAPFWHNLGPFVWFQKFLGKSLEGYWKVGVREHPVTATILPFLPIAAVGWLLSSLAGETEEDRTKRDMVAGDGFASWLKRMWVLPLPGSRDESGALKYVDLSSAWHMGGLANLTGATAPAYGQERNRFLAMNPLVNLGADVVTGETEFGERIGGGLQRIAFAAQKLAPVLTGIPASAELVRQHGPGGEMGAERRLGQQVGRVTPGTLYDDKRMEGVARSKIEEAGAKAGEGRNERNLAIRRISKEIEGKDPGEASRIIDRRQQEMRAAGMRPLENQDWRDLLQANRERSPTIRALLTTRQGAAARLMFLRDVIDKGQLTREDAKAAWGALGGNRAISGSVYDIASSLGLSVDDAQQWLQTLLRDLDKAGR